MSLKSSCIVHKEGSKDNRGVTHYTVVYQVIVDDPLENSGVVALYVPGDVFTSVYPYDALARLKRKTASLQNVPDDGGLDWRVTLEFDSEPTDQGATGALATDPGGVPAGDPGAGTSAETPPDQRVPTITLDSVEVKELRRRDLTIGVNAPPEPDGYPIVNSAGAPYVPPLEVTVYRPQITITLFKEIADDSVVNCMTYVGKTNSTTFMGFPPNKLLCKKYSLASQYEHGAWWWAKTVVLEAKSDGYNPIYVIDCGTYEIGGVKIKDASGENVSEPYPLDLNGHKLAEGLEPKSHEFTGYYKVAYTNIL